MSLIRLQDVTKHFGGTPVFAEVSASVEPGVKVGLVGRNGSGKSTLLKVIAGREHPDAGSVTRASRATVGFFAQDMAPASDQTLAAFLSESFREILDLRTALSQCEQALADPAIHGDEKALESTMTRYASLRERFERAGGYQWQASLRAAAFGLGFGEADLEREVSTFSGGERVRAELARLLLDGPDLLLLDEPTNHLDLEAVEWLEGFLADFRGTLIVVSHDRYFLDKVTVRTWEIENLHLFTYSGNFTASRALRQERRERQRKEYEANRKEAEKLEAYIRKYKAGNRSTQAKSREKMLQRLDLDGPPPPEEGGLRVRVDEVRRSGREVMITQDLATRYDDNVVFRGVNLTVNRGDRLGILGPNGVGKSTLLQALARELQPDAGTVMYGEAVTVGYFSQDFHALNPENTILEELLDVHNRPVGEMRSLLARFLFVGDEVFKTVGVLSGGERSRVALAKLLLSNANCLLLDEPTNHLDIVVRSNLEDLLRDYPGTIVFVSHDRYFIHALATRIGKLEAGGMSVFDGDYEAFRAHEKARREQAVRAAAARDSGSKAAARRDQPAAVAFRRRKRLQELEEEIVRVEADKKMWEERLASPDLYGNGDEAKEAVSAYDEIVRRIEALLEQWATLAEEEEDTGN